MSAVVRVDMHTYFKPVTHIVAYFFVVRVDMHTYFKQVTHIVAYFL